MCSVGTSAAQADRSHASGFFLGLGIDGDDVVSNGRPGVNESGIGGGLVVGYGFSPRWSIYGEGGSALMKAADGSGNYGLTHGDIGARVHFRSGPHVVVPFIQVGASAREARTYARFPFLPSRVTLTARGDAITFGGGLNAHVNPAWAVSGAMTWSAGNYTDFKASSALVYPPAPGSSAYSTSARIHIGMIWFAGA